MKSNEAREIILKSKKDVEEGNLKGDVAHIDANHAVQIAEQDAEKRLLSLFKKELYEDGLMKNSPWIAERIFQRVVVEINKG